MTRENAWNMAISSVHVATTSWLAQEPDHVRAGWISDAVHGPTPHRFVPRNSRGETGAGPVRRGPSFSTAACGTLRNDRGDAPTATAEANGSAGPWPQDRRARSPATADTLEAFT